MSETTLRDTLAAAVEEYQSLGNETESEASERTRDEQGRFKAQEKEIQEEIKAEEQVVVEQAIEEPRRVIPRPTSWKKEYENDWETLPGNIREYILDREGQYAKGVSTYKNQWDSASPIYEAVAPFLPELQQNNINPSQWIQNLGNAHRTLALGTPDEKLQMFSRLATDYGINLESLTGHQYNPQFGMLAQELSQIKNQFTQLQTIQQQQEQAKLNNEIQEFAATAPHFEAVRDTMANLLQSGMATDLKTAYEKAIRLHDDVWQKQQEEHSKAAEAERMKEVQAKKAKAVSPKSASPTGAMNSGTGKKSLRDQLAETVEASLGGHF
jgi:hypothetical protein